MLLNVPLVDTVTATDAFSAGSEGYIVGTPPVWKDDSTGTYASFAGQYAGNGNPQFVGAAQAAVAASPPDIHAATAIIARFQVAGVAGSNLAYPTVRLERGTTYTFNGTVAGSAPGAPGWVEATLTSGDALAMSDFLANPAVYNLAVLAPLYASPNVPNEIQRWNVYEARLYVLTPRRDAPPCRLLQRSDGLGVGSGRNYPPPKSQQRSFRGVGYY